MGGVTDDPNLPLGIRVGDAERAAAVRALGVHLETGRLDADEYGSRFAHAGVARTRGDLSALFVDLPSPHALSAVSDATRPTIRRRSTGPVGAPAFGRVGRAAVSAAPFVALVLFLVLGLPWFVFLLVPVLWVCVYSNVRGARRGRRRGRRKF